MPNPPGTGLDIVARLFAERLAARSKQPVVVENIPGADGSAARNLSPNATTTRCCIPFPGLITINPLTYEKLPYDPMRDLVPIASTSDNFVGHCGFRQLESRLARGAGGS